MRHFYVADNVSSTYHSLATLKALGVEQSFPRFGTASSKMLAATYSPLSAANLVASSQPTAKLVASVPPCQNTGVLLEEDKPCSCLLQALPPTTPIVLPCAPMEENLLKLKKWLLDHYAYSSFNVCKPQALPMLQFSPPPQAVGRPRGHADCRACPILVPPSLAGGHVGGP